VGEPPAGERRNLSKPAPLLPLTRNGLPAVRLVNGELSEIRWTLTRGSLTNGGCTLSASCVRIDFSIGGPFSAPGRVSKNLPHSHSGTDWCFDDLRPAQHGGFSNLWDLHACLMALAFRNTGLLYGLGIFAGVVLVGYVVRRWINRLRLLLVPRLSVILTLVIIFFTVFALIGNKVGLRELMAVGLLPFVILTMTIERFFVITEEAGVREDSRPLQGALQ